jgi:tetratricopeptide (TPR) repeat protein
MSLSLTISLDSCSRFEFGVDSMSFRSDFFDEIRSTNPALPMSARESVFLNTIDRGLTAQHRELGLIREQIQSTFSEAVDRYREASDEASETIANEIAYQAEEDRRVALEIADEINWNIEQARVYLGAQISEVRWAVERNTEATKSILDALWKTHWIDSRQFFDEGVECYQSGEKEFARERFQKATEACRTNGFAYQYLGFLSAHDDDKAQTLRYFELAAKFAPNDHHKAIAHYHLSRALHASGNETASLEQIRLSVALAPKDLPYRFELVRALMRTGFRQDAISELRKLISADLRYWTAVEIDQSLDPMRAEISRVLGELRDEERLKANRLSADFLETIRVVESLPEALPLEFRSASEWKKELDRLLEKGTIFAYREIVNNAITSHKPYVEMATGRYKKGISYLDTQLINLAAGNQAIANGFNAQIQYLAKQAEQIINEFNGNDAQLMRDFKSKEGGYGLALGCTGCLATLGLVIFAGIFFEFFAIKASRGLPDTIGKLVIFLPLILPLPVIVIARRIWYQNRRRNLQHTAHARGLEIESRVRAVEASARAEYWKNTQELEHRRAEFQRLQTIYRSNISLLEKRLAVATAG